MGVRMDKVEPNVVKFEIEVAAEEFEEGLEKAFKKNAGRFNVPGFRKGKAPRAVVERHYGEQILYKDAINFICPEAYEKAVKENNIKPVDVPEIDIVQIGKGKAFIFTATVTVKPEVELGEYKGIEVTKKKAEVTDEDVEQEIENIREKNSRLVTVEGRAVQNGDTVIIDFEGFIDGKPFEGGKGTKWNLVIGSEQFVAGFEEQLVGAAAGEERDVQVMFPEDYYGKDLAGKSAVFKVKVHEIKKKELPVIDDEFAKDVSEFETLEELKQSLKEKLLEREERKIKSEIEDSIVEKVTKNSSVTIPAVMIEKQIDSILQDFDMRLRLQGITLEKYLEMSNINHQDFRKQFEERAREEVKTQLVLEKIADDEGISASDAEYEEELEKQARNYRYSVEDFKKHLTNEDIEYIKSRIAIGKTIDFLVEQAKMV